MKKTTRLLCTLLIVIFSLCSLFACKNNGENGTTYDQTGYSIQINELKKGKTVKTLDTVITNYVKNCNRVDILSQTLFERQQEKQGNKFKLYDFQSVNISWEDNGKNESYTVHVADNIEFNNEFTFVTSNTAISNEIGIFIPGKTYYYKIVGSKKGESVVDSFVVSDKNSVRYISADTVKNVRDLGGWTTVDGKKLNYGKIYRGAALNEGPSHSYLSDNAKKVFNYLKIKGELDLRGDNRGDSDSENDNSTWNLNKINSSYPILREGLAYFTAETMAKNDNVAMNNLPKIFEFLSNGENYPVYFHCSVGADRTGLLGYILEALLGVDFEHIMVDYELTSFSDLNLTGGIRSRSNIIEKEDDVYEFETPTVPSGNISLLYAHNKLMERYKEYSDNLQEVMEQYLLDMGVSQNQIDKVKEIMLSK